MTLVLVLDASTPVVSVGLARVEDDSTRTLLAELTLPGVGASETLLRAVEAALDLSGEELSGVGEILVGIGPGTFTGIRIAAATARSLAFATGADLAVNSTLAALAAPAAYASGDVLAVLDAKRRQVFAQRFTTESGRVVPAGGILCVAPEELTDVEGSPLIVGDGSLRYREVLNGVGDIPPDASALHRVGASGHLASADLSPVPMERVVPLYVREPDAEVRRDLNPWAQRRSP